MEDRLDTHARREWEHSVVSAELGALLRDAQAPPRGLLAALLASLALLACAVGGNIAVPSRWWLATACVLIALLLVGLEAARSRRSRAQEGRRHAELVHGLEVPGRWVLEAPRVMAWLEEACGERVRETFEALAKGSDEPGGVLLASAEALEEGEADEPGFPGRWRARPRAGQWRSWLKQLQERAPRSRTLR
jgi:hypothetical protein